MIDQIIHGHLLHDTEESAILDAGGRITAANRIFLGDVCLVRDQKVYRFVGKPLEHDRIAIACDGFYQGEAIRFVVGPPQFEIQ